MKISLCIPQYNRIQYLLKNLSIIEEQTYTDIEIVISDDASTDNTRELIENFQKTSKYPVLYYQHPSNVGYDANLRKSLELSSGDYCMMMGNDDTLLGSEAINDLVEFLIANKSPEIGFCNYVEDHCKNIIIERASGTLVVGSGEEVAMKYYRSFSYVAGIIIRKDIFNQVNTNKADGSVFVQMYFAAQVIAKGGRFFMYKKPLIIKDIQIGGTMANSYRDTLMKTWKEFRPIDGGLKQVAWAVIEGFKDAGIETRRITYKVLKNIYMFPYTYWLLDYRSNGSFVGAVALTSGMKPSGVKEMSDLNIFQKIKIYSLYYLFSLVGLFLPVFAFRKLKNSIYKLIKK